MYRSGLTGSQALGVGAPSSTKATWFFAIYIYKCMNDAMCSI